MNSTNSAQDTNTAMKIAPMKIEPIMIGPMKIERTNVLGVGVCAINIPMAIEVIDQWVDTQTPNYVCVTGVHGVMECQSDPALRMIHNRAGLVTPDGMPLVWLNKLMGQRQVDRVYGPDLMYAYCQHAATRNYRHFLYGSSEEVLGQLVCNLRERIPDINLVGSYSPPFRAMSIEEDQAIVEQINAAEPDIVWVGLSTPKQEHWMAAHRERLTAPVLIGVGAAFDFHAGTKTQAPYWMQRSGLEWFFRLLSEPRRLWRRYLINNPRFVLSVLLQIVGLRHYPIQT
jgi:N-acetylglucosaminyldiphosphoundecaprenol N-acetyl-beta-D-mannosaminyltransferase